MLLSILLFVCLAQSSLSFNAFDNDCCVLSQETFPVNWMDVRLPKDAVSCGPSGYSSLNVPSYLAYVNEKDTGSITHLSYWQPMMYSPSVNPQAPLPNVTYITNPLGCSIKWWKRGAHDQFPFSNSWASNHYQPPPLGYQEHPHFKKTFIGRSKYNDVSPFGCHMVDVLQAKGPKGPEYVYRTLFPPGFQNLRDQNAEIMYIDCNASLVNILHAELVDIQYNADTLKKGPVTLETNTITNNGPRELAVSLKWRTNITNTVKVSMESESTRDVAWRIGASAKIFGIGMEGYYEKKWHDFVKKGYMSITTVERASESSNSMSAPPHSLVKASLETSPMSGTIDFTAVYKIKPFNPDHLRFGLTVDRMKSMLIRAGFDKDKLNSKDDTLTLEYKGKMDVDSGHDTKFVVTTTNLTTGESTTHSYSAAMTVTEV